MSKPSFLFTSSTFGPLKHVVQIKVALTAVRISFTPLYLLCTHFRQPVHWIEFLPTPFFTHGTRPFAWFFFGHLTFSCHHHLRPSHIHFQPPRLHALPPSQHPVPQPPHILRHQ